MLSSDGTEDDLEVVELEQASRSIAVSESGSESNPETLEVFVSKCYASWCNLYKAASSGARSWFFFSSCHFQAV